MLNVHKIFYGSRIYGPGIRDVIWFKGCSLHCKGCINPELWSKKIENPYTPDELPEFLKHKEVTLLGGEPLEQEDIHEFISALKQKDIGVILFTGYSLKNLTGKQLAAAQLCDAVLSEPYLEEEKDDSLYLMGSRNQKLSLFSERYKKEDFERQNSYEVLLNSSVELHGRNKTLVQELLGI